MVKRFFSKVVRVGGARVSIVGLGVISAVILGIAATVLPPSGTAIATGHCFDAQVWPGPNAHVSVEKTYQELYPPNRPDLKAVKMHGIGAGLTVHKPSVGNCTVPPEKWSASLVAIGNWDPIPFEQPAAFIEYGWMVAPSFYQDNEPHLVLLLRKEGDACFVSGNGFGEGSCGFTPVSNPQNIEPNEDLTKVNPPVVNLGTSNKYGPQMFHVGYFAGNNAWWIQFRDRWIGYVKASWFKTNNPFSTPFTRATYAYWYGEAVSTSNDVPCAPLQVGNGLKGTQAGSARFAGMYVEKQGAPGLVYTQSAEPNIVEHPEYWDGKATGPSSFSYGGPGKPC